MKKPTEQEGAFAQIRALAEPHRFTVQADDEGFPIIPGNYGQIEWYDAECRELAAYSTHRRIFGKLSAVPNATRHQVGDNELRIRFPREAVEQVAGVIQAKRKRGVSTETARKLGFKPRNKGHFETGEGPSDSRAG